MNERDQHVRLAQLVSGLASEQPCTLIWLAPVKKIRNRNFWSRHRHVIIVGRSFTGLLGVVTKVHSGSREWNTPERER